MVKTTAEQTDSFTTKVKSELAGLKIRRFEDARALLCAFTLCIGSLKFVPQKRSWGVHYSLKSREAIELCAKLCAQHYDLECSISEVRHERLKANNCELVVFGEGIERFMQSVGMMSVDGHGEREFSPKVPEDAATTDAQMRAFIRGLFLACGMMNDPEKAYHLEFVINSASLAGRAAGILSSRGIAPNRSKRKNSIVLYVKEGEKLEDLLAFIGASEAMMLVSNERIIKQANNTANRYVNCTTANMNRVCAAAKKQAEDIELVLKTLGAEALGEELLVAAKGRLDNPELSLTDLADELNMGRSAVNYRLKKLERMAEEIRGGTIDN
ncbi:MAG: DNA-binding protein WhiA [Clostridia bacterium]|nr:DNA-binding protein WhiA [Clostridia bacterium]